MSAITRDSSPSTPHQRVVGTPTFALWMFLTFGVLVPAYFTSVPPGELLRAPVLLSIVVLLLAITQIVILLSAPQAKPVQLMFWVFVYLFFGLTALAQTSENRFPIADQGFDDQTQSMALVVVLVGCLGHRIGVALVEGRPESERLGRGVLLRLELHRRRVILVGAVGVLAVLAFTARYGLATRFSSRATIADLAIRGSQFQRVDLRANKAGGLLAVALDWVPIFIALYCFVSWWQSRSEADPKRRWPHLRGPAVLGLGALILGNVLANNPVINPRYRAGGVLIALALAIWPPSTPKRFRVFGVGVLLGLILVFPFADYFRNSERQIERASPRELLVTSPDYGMYQQELNARVYVHDHGFSYGTQSLGAVLAIVPRAIWPGKPLDTGNIILRSDIINASASLWATLYVDGGVGLVFVGLMGFGAASAVFERSYRKRDPTRVTLVSLGVPLFAAFELFILRGDMQPVIGELLPVATLCLLVCRPVRSRAPDPVVVEPDVRR